MYTYDEGLTMLEVRSLNCITQIDAVRISVVLKVFESRILSVTFDPIHLLATQLSYAALSEAYS